MDTNAIVNAAMQQLVSSVADAVILKLKAEGLANMTLDPEATASALIVALSDSDVRDELRDLIDERTNEMESRISCLEDNPTANIDISDNDDFTDLKSEVESLKARVEGSDITKIDADDSDFDTAVMQVLRNNI